MKNSSIDRVLKAGIGLLLLLFVGILYSSIHERVVNVGDTGPDFSIMASNGKQTTRSDFGGKVLLLNFWATWCEPCVQELPSLDQLARRFKSRGLVVLGVSIDKDAAAYRRFLTRFRLGFPTADDPEQKINHDYGTIQVPETYIIDANGKVIDKIVGAANWTDDKMIEHVQSLL
jgi:cytochrome c biogenesis protein CcmG/thiol:disulfide interchange protein DsbE